MARNARGKSPAARSSPPPSSTAVVGSKSKTTKSKNDYSSDGVEDNDVFLLPISDFQIALVVTILAAIVRLYRIYQPSSVVFDEVQYVCPEAPKEEADMRVASKMV